MKRAAYMMVAVALGSGAARADGWSTNAWPSWDWQRAGALQATNVYAALRERYTGTVPAPKLWRSQRYNLSTYKGKIKLCCGEFVDFVAMDGSNVVDWLALYTNLPVWTVTGLCATALLPTNYMDYTPWRCLNGLGPNTNDSTAPRPYGWTNASTQAGGTPPGGRAAWYTTDYGWQGVHDCLNLLTAKMVFATWYYPDATNARVWRDATGTNTEWVTSQYNASTNAADEVASNNGRAAWTAGRLTTAYAASARRGFAYLVPAVSLSTAAEHQVQAYVQVTTARRTFVSEPAQFQFDGQGLYVHGWNDAGTTAWTTNSVPQVLFGSTNLVLPAWCVEPTSNTNQVRGYEAAVDFAPLALVRWRYLYMGD
jgi:hypothetical protein